MQMIMENFRRYKNHKKGRGTVKDNYSYKYMGQDI